MNAQDLIDTARMLVADYKGLLAMDESNPTCNPHSAPWGVTQHNYAEDSIFKVINYAFKQFFNR
ncbi:hypothetical protein QUA13_01260 [Microcoleus sp. S28C3]|uniref:hypothetical protein n=1 Tax=Microcoleus sp. S28C3 TaxID=3055414 RepID=UPI002FD64C78